MYITVRKR